MFSVCSIGQAPANESRQHGERNVKAGIGCYLIRKDSDAELKPENKKEQHSFDYQEKQKRSPIRIVGSFKDQPDVVCV
jgi:hypothetical protein